LGTAKLIGSFKSSQQFKFDAAGCEAVNELYQSFSLVLGAEALNFFILAECDFVLRQFFLNKSHYADVDIIKIR
jgi:hypothetical protein